MTVVEKAVDIVVDTVTDYIDADSILVQRLAEHLVQRLSRAGLLIAHIDGPGCADDPHITS